MKITSPSEANHFVEKLLDKIGSEYEPEMVPILVEPYATIRNCFPNVEEKVRRDGGKVHYGWAIYQTSILCEAERHSVWESGDGDLIDITPKEEEFTSEQIMFVPDNDFVYEGQLIDNIRVNITNNPVVDDFILICESLEKMYCFGERVDDEHIRIPEPANALIGQYENLKVLYLNYIYSGGKPASKCFCGGQKSYKNCHGSNLREYIKNDWETLKHKIEKL